MTRALIVTLLFLTACATSMPGEPYRDPSVVLRELGVDPTIVVHYARSRFGIAPKHIYSTATFDGVYVQTKKAVLIFGWDAKGETYRKNMEIPLEKIEGIGLHKYGRSRQIQFRTDTNQMTVTVMPNDISGWTYPKLTEKAFVALVTFGIPVFEPSEPIVTTNQRNEGGMIPIIIRR